MQDRADYYRILQVHYLAEPEVIDSAYKRLARKYHPDVCKSPGSDAAMQQINEAYATLKDAKKRKRYDEELAARRENTAPAGKGRNAGKPAGADVGDESIAPARAVLTGYFAHLKNKNFEKAYELITSADKSNITLEDFIKWQGNVSRIFQLQEYECKAGRAEDGSRPGGTGHGRAVEFIVSTVEHNTVMNRMEKDIIQKRVVLEKEGWRILVGYEDIRPHIARFEELNELKRAKSVIHEMIDLYSNIDHQTGLLNKKGFIEAAGREIYRHGRYNNKFSLLLIEMNEFWEGNAGSGGLRQYSLEWTGRILGDCFRSLDIAGRWEETGFIVLLPETDLNGGIKAAVKLSKLLEAKRLFYDNRVYRPTFRIGVGEYEDSLENTIRTLSRYLDTADRPGGTQIVHARGRKTIG
jgi:diguanylate cyclase (GGDEF)-like protein